MKRSDMIKKIVYQALSYDALKNVGVPLEEIANDVLKVIEKTGMKPPSCQKHPWLEPEYEWEPEDEKI